MSGGGQDIYDLAIIGAGPAGLSAGIYAGRAKLKTIILEKGLPGGTVLLTWDVDNYPGFPGGSGTDLIAIMEKQARRFEVEIAQEEVLDLKPEGEIKEVVTASGTRLARGVIIATGAHPRTLGIPGEKKFTGRGVSYCATCDAAFFQGLSVAVIGGGDTAVEEAVYLTRFASRVYLIHRRDKLRATDSLQENLLARENVEVVWDSVAEEVLGDEAVTGLALKNIKTEERSRLDVQGVFIFIGIIPNSDFIKGKVEMDNWGFIRTDDHMRTEFPDLYAVGDVRSKEMRQIINACSEGATAAFLVEKSLKKY